jgi:ribosomal protein S7
MKLKTIKHKITNRLLINGKKQISEKIFQKSLKLIQKNQKKKSFSNIIKIALINSAPSLYLKQIKRKPTTQIEFPFLLTNDLKIFYSSKFIVNSSKKKNNFFYKNFSLELLNSAQNIGESVKKKKELHKLSFQKKKYTNYRWF